jgi:hypothetical protein
MTKISRRRFLSNIVRTASGAIVIGSNVPLLSSCISTNKSLENLWVGPWLEEAADIIRNNQIFFELTVHGVGHEYWEGCEPG